jgi:hypothetical protein
MLDYGEYSTVPEALQEANPLSYEQYLEGDWGLFYKIASYFIHKVRFDDRQDFLHDLMLEMAKVKAKYEAKGKPLTEAGLMRVASYELSEYWVKLRRLTTWLDCGNCSKEQRRKCREQLLYSECPKYHQLISLNTVIEDGDGHKTELIETIADDKAIDLEAWLNEATWRLGFPKRLAEIAHKLAYGIRLTKYEQLYLCRFRKREQKRLIG